MTLALAARPEASAMSAIPGEITETSLVLREGLSFEEWQQAGQTLQRIEKSVRWWIGDWLAYGERVYGETYAQAIETTGYSYDDLRHMHHVAARVQSGHRCPNLSWSHHREVAPLELPEQDRWLEKAEKEDWSASELRTQLRLTRHIAAHVPLKPGTCPRCGRPCAMCEMDILAAKKKTGKKKGGKR